MTLAKKRELKRLEKIADTWAFAILVGGGLMMISSAIFYSLLTR